MVQIFNSIVGAVFRRTADSHPEQTPELLAQLSELREVKLPLIEKELTAAGIEYNSSGISNFGPEKGGSLGISITIPEYPSKEFLERLAEITFPHCLRVEVTKALPEQLATSTGDMSDRVLIEVIPAEANLKMREGLQ